MQAGKFKQGKRTMGSGIGIRDQAPGVEGVITTSSKAGTVAHNSSTQEAEDSKQANLSYTVGSRLGRPCLKDKRKLTNEGSQAWQEGRGEPAENISINYRNKQDKIPC